MRTTYRILLTLATLSTFRACALTDAQQERLWDKGLSVVDRVIDSKIPKSPSK